LERQFWGFEAPQGGRVWSCETGPGSGIRAYPVFASEEKARQFAGALFLDEPEMQRNMLSSIRRIEVREIPKAANVSVDPTLLGDEAVMPIEKWGGLFAEFN
jgi:hypothetical protein